ncbi:AlpA family phage regulatory protein [Pseudophaeobacter sp.]|uniref:helix-turn-helix transcriptional regulator n=1 Tax=Pseudophaeobacter sp. TaxID=1971739 RepID=UPI00329A1F7A
MATTSHQTDKTKAEPPGRVLISAAQGAKMIGVADSTWWDWANVTPDFPKPIRISARCTRWDRSEIMAWLEKRRVA